MELPWLSPSAASLLALARAPAAAVWSEVRFDPGCVLLVLRHCAATHASSGLSFFPSLVRDPAVLEGAVQHLETVHGGAEAGRCHSPFAARPSPLSGFVDWSQPAAWPVYRASLTFAAVAQVLAERSGKCDPDNAWVGGMLASLGWLAAAAVSPDLTAACLGDAAFSQRPGAVQQQHWGLDHAGLSRRLCRRWQLPRWLAAIPSALGFTVATAKALGGDPDLFLVAQLAVRLVQQQNKGLHLAVGAPVTEIAAALDLSLDEIAAIEPLVSEFESKIENRKSKTENPATVPLLHEVLRLAAQNRRLTGAVVIDALEADLDVMHQGLEGQIAREEEHLRAQKLAALAEFAAGAGHEINNPLAVISGQAQYLLLHEAELPRQKALQTIIGQTKRINHVLTDLMQFARPPRPQKKPVDVPALIREVAASLQELAGQRQVRLECQDMGSAPLANGGVGSGGPVNGNGVNGDSANGHGDRNDHPATPPGGAVTHRAPFTIYADRQQLSTALTCLLRNAIEAAPPEGWASVRLEVNGPESLDLVVEDSGAGPGLAHREHLFDPFYSGRAAGRGRGLGLATAWRLAREHGGDVRFDIPPGGPTRFVLSLPQN
jgi:signal transduction histidine kinase